MQTKPVEINYYQANSYDKLVNIPCDFGVQGKVTSETGDFSFSYMEMRGSEPEYMMRHSDKCTLSAVADGLTCNIKPFVHVECGKYDLKFKLNYLTYKEYSDITELTYTLKDIHRIYR